MRNALKIPTPLTCVPPTFPPHARLETLLEAAVLALVPMVLVYRAVATAPACVGQVPSDAALEETFTAFAGELTVVFPRTLVPTHHTFDLLLVAVRHARVGRARTVIVVVATTTVVVIIAAAIVIVVIVVAAAMVMVVAVMVMMMWRGARWRDGVHRNDRGTRPAS